VSRAAGRESVSTLRAEERKGGIAGLRGAARGRRGRSAGLGRRSSGGGARLRSRLVCRLAGGSVHGGCARRGGAAGWG